MPKQKKGGKKKVVAGAPYDVSKTKAQKAQKAKKDKTSALFEKRPKNFGIGQDIQPKRDLTRYVKWPQYVRLQRKKRVLLTRLKVPPTIHQFSRTLDKPVAKRLFGLLDKYKPETRSEKRDRLKKKAEHVAALKPGEASPVDAKPVTVKYGINHVTSLVESKKAKLLVIAHDVDPIELVLWLPALARKMGVPYCIVKGKARLGQVVNKKTATALVVTNVAKEDQAALTQLIEAITETFNERYEDSRKQWGGLVLGRKSQDKIRMKQKALEASKLK